MKRFALSLALLSLAGCITPQGTAKVRAANDFGCPEDGISIAEIGGTSYRASGCGKSAVYNCSASDAYKGSTSNYACVPETPPATITPAAPPAAAPPAVAPAAAPPAPPPVAPPPAAM